MKLKYHATIFLPWRCRNLNDEYPTREARHYFMWVQNMWALSKHSILPFMDSGGFIAKSVVCYFIRRKGDIENVPFKIRTVYFDFLLYSQLSIYFFQFYVRKRITSFREWLSRREHCSFVLWFLGLLEIFWSVRVQYFSMINR